MKKIVFILLALHSILLTGCSEDDKPVEALQGRWNLIEVSGGFGGGGEQFQRGDITWTFNENNQTIVVTDNRLVVPHHPGFGGLPEGTHNYTLSAEGEVCDEALHVDNINFGCVSIQGNHLQLSMNHADGLVHTFIR